MPLSTLQDCVDHIQSNNAPPVEHSRLHQSSGMADMEKINFEYSLKNIPTPSKKNYTKLMIDKTEHFLKRMRWKAFLL